MHTRWLSLLTCSVLFVSVAHAELPPWSYDEDLGTGPSQWGTFSTTCESGTRQSPIDLVPAAPHSLQPLHFDYHRANYSVENTGRTVEVALEDEHTLRIGSHEYTLAQFHFHTPSEHRLNGVAHAAELHLVHRDQQGRLAVVGVFLREGAANSAFAKVLAHAPDHVGEVDVHEGRFNPAWLLPGLRKYTTYRGSLTTPPCDEGVRWIVLDRPVEISATQVQQLRDLLESAGGYPENARPVQPRNGRSVLHRGHGH